MTRALLERALALLQNCDVSTGVCCCGSPVDKHGMSDGHSPVDEGAHFAARLLEDIAKHLGAAPTRPNVPEYSALALRKLQFLLDRGYEITGVSIKKDYDGYPSSQGFVTDGGFVGWWQPDVQEVPAPPAKPPYAIQAADVHKLRQLTDEPLMECKKALTVCEGDIDKAVEYMRDARNYKHHLYVLTDGPRL